ncbi:MAG: outer membrane lipoprotein carrier protein LolA [Ignavibacteriae bacterium]|nr:MAG: outer membrane lipoprotein carrier protein LolA [Ignavibacteriota bacterium]
MKKTAIFILFICILIPNIYSQDNITAQEIIQNVQNVYKDISDAKASFTQTVKYGKSKAQSSSGTLYIKKDNKYRIETGSQTIVTDGSTSWSYSPSKKQVVIDNYKETGNTFSPNKYLFQYPENFYSDLEGNENMSGKEMYVLKLRPREGGYVKSAKLWVDKAEWIIKKIQIVTDESTTTYNVKNVQLNVGISNSKFTFSPPEGTEIIDMR